MENLGYRSRPLSAWLGGRQLVQSDIDARKERAKGENTGFVPQNPSTASDQKHEVIPEEVNGLTEPILPQTRLESTNQPLQDHS